ncbi:pseudouridine synthase [Azoarcus taiwanensis]|uniref:Pseudouridine synthase n=1 Tax=Azoarcus taiwanensis TaxID=666964 RepID=A0A972JAH9_9RHOO|nr:pseudouridine synthase [Azoarcus taiwanensis]
MRSQRPSCESWILSRLILLNKPYGVVCQFSGDGTRPTLADHVGVPGVYPAGRLDTDSEGLLLLTDDGGVQHRIADPKHKLPKTYLAQVEGEPDDAALARLRAGVNLGDFITRPCEVRRVTQPDWLWPRDPPVRFRKSVPTSWLEIVLREGKNRQVRRMTAAVGFPTLRLIRLAVGPFRLDGLAPGIWREESIPAELGAATRPDRVRRQGGRGGRIPQRTNAAERRR